MSFPTRDDCPTCKRDDLGRLCIGFCNPTKCLMAKERAKRLEIRMGCTVEGCHQPVLVSGGERCEAHATRHARFAR